MNKAPSFQFYPKDFLSDMNVVLMSNQEVGCYIKLLCHCWEEGYIPSDIESIAKLCGENGSAMTQLWHSHISKCFQPSGEDGKLVNPRLMEEREKQLLHKQERSKSGTKGALSRWKQDDNNKNGSAIDLPLNKNGSAINQPLAKNGSSSSIASAIIKKDTSCLKKSTELPQQLQNSKEIWPTVFDEELKSLFKKFLQHCVDIGKRPSDAMVDKFKGQCVSMGKSRSIAALQNSIEKRAYTIWEPFYETKQTNSFSKQNEEQDKPRRNFWRGHYRDINGDPEDDDGNPINEDGTPRTVNK